MEAPTLTEEQKFWLYVRAGCELEFGTGAGGAYVIRIKNPVGCVWNGKGWVVGERRER